MTHLLSLLPGDQTGNPRSLSSKFDKRSLNELLSRYGIAETVASLTNSQGKYLLTFGTVDAIRNRLSSSRQAGGIQVDAGPSAQDKARDSSEILQGLRSGAVPAPSDDVFRRNVPVNRNLVEEARAEREAYGQNMTSRLACLDHSAAKDGPLVPYRWKGESHINPEHYVSHI